MLKCADTPSPAILCLKDAQVKLDALLHHSVGTIGATAALGVTFIYRLSCPDPYLPSVIVGDAVQGGPGAAAIHWLL